MELPLLVRAKNLPIKSCFVKLLFTICCFGSFGLEVSVQAQKQCTTSSDAHVVSDKPTVYITYEGIGQLKRVAGRLAATDLSNEEKLKGENIKVVFFRLHNNTRWAISFPTESLYVGGAKTMPLRLCDGSGELGLRNGIEVDARYDIEVIPGNDNVRKPKVANRIDVFSDSWLGSGYSVTFSVPSEYIKEPLAVYLRFNYEWEVEKGHLKGGEPEHRAYFYPWNLPEDIR